MRFYIHYITFYICLYLHKSNCQDHCRSWTCNLLHNSWLQLLSNCMFVTESLSKILTLGIHFLKKFYISWYLHLSNCQDHCRSWTCNLLYSSWLQLLSDSVSVTESLKSFLKYSRCLAEDMKLLSGGHTTVIGTIKLFCNRTSNKILVFFPTKFVLDKLSVRK